MDIEISQKNEELNENNSYKKINDFEYIPLKSQ
jgi:hypothetical protein